MKWFLGLVRGLQGPHAEVFITESGRSFVSGRPASSEPSQVARRPVREIFLQDASTRPEATRFQSILAGILRVSHRLLGDFKGFSWFERGFCQHFGGFACFGGGLHGFRVCLWT